MKRIVYTRPDDGGVSIICAAAKKSIEKVLGPLTEAEYETHVRERSIPKDAIKVRDVNDSDVPTDRELRNAWCDTTSESRIDINCKKALDIRLENLRRDRTPLLAQSDIEYTRAMEDDDQVKIDALKIYRQDLRDVTEPLKALNVTGKVNDEALLTQMKTLSEVLKEE